MLASNRRSVGRGVWSSDGIFHGQASGPASKNFSFFLIDAIPDLLRFVNFVWTCPRAVAVAEQLCLLLSAIFATNFLQLTGNSLALIFHVAAASDVENASQSGSYVCDSIDAEGFIHCCKPDQLQGVIERYYNGVKGLLLLHIDTDLLQSKLVFENTSGGSELFPHVYGAINMDAVVQIASV